MRCKKHLSDVSSSVGVCASCLRERLLFLIDAQTQAHRRHLTPADEDRRNSDPKPHQRQQIPPPLVFPRSVSPYISRRKSDASRNGDLSDQLRQRFFSTPQVVPTANKKKKSKFHAISKLFRSRSTKSAYPTTDPATDPSFSVSNSGQNAGSRKVSALGLFSLDETSACDGRRGRRFGSRNRGMSPDVREDESEAGSLSPSGYSPEQWKRTPSSGRGWTRTSQAQVKASPARSQVVSRIGICLSPLMRPSPSRHWKGVGPGGGAAEAAYSGEIRSTVKPHLSTAASLRANRSRKLVDLGRFNYNR